MWGRILIDKCRNKIRWGPTIINSSWGLYIKWNPTLPHVTTGLVREDYTILSQPTIKWHMVTLSLLFLSLSFFSSFSFGTACSPLPLSSTLFSSSLFFFLSPPPDSTLFLSSLPRLSRSSPVSSLPSPSSFHPFITHTMNRKGDEPIKMELESEREILSREMHCDWECDAILRWTVAAWPLKNGKSCPYSSSWVWFHLDFFGVLLQNSEWVSSMGWL
jgi:hypothetical protein